MTLRNIASAERFDFDDAEDLREWLNRFTTTDLRAVSTTGPDGGALRLYWETETLSDGSTVYNIRLA